jgi:hypothetical protein
MFRSNSTLSAEDNLILVGVGFLIGGILAIIVMKSRLAAEYPIRWAVTIVGMIVGTALILLGIILK